MWNWSVHREFLSSPQEPVLHFLKNYPFFLTFRWEEGGMRWTKSKAKALSQNERCSIAGEKETHDFRACGIKHSLEGAALGFFSPQNVLKTIKVFRKLESVQEQSLLFQQKAITRFPTLGKYSALLSVGRHLGWWGLLVWHTEPGLTAFLSRSQNCSLIKKTCPSHPTVCADTRMPVTLTTTVGSISFPHIWTFLSFGSNQSLTLASSTAGKEPMKENTQSPHQRNCWNLPVPECNPLEKAWLNPKWDLIFNNLLPSTSPVGVSKVFPISRWMEEKMEANCSVKGCSYLRGCKSSEMQVPKENGSSLLHGISNDSSNSVHFPSKDDQYSLRSLCCLQMALVFRELTV